MNAPASPVGRGRAQFLLLAALFFAPLLLAILFYFGLPGLQPEHKTNYGQLVVPAPAVPRAARLAVVVPRAASAATRRAVRTL